MSDKLLAEGCCQLPACLSPAASRRTIVEVCSQPVLQLHFQFLHADLSLSRPAHGRSVLRQLGKSLHFPDWYGANFDALFDCLCDPDWQPARATFC
jgi:hypothetical protein